jgi:hypothetical protein
MGSVSEAYYASTPVPIPSTSSPVMRAIIMRPRFKVGFLLNVHVIEPVINKCHAFGGLPRSSRRDFNFGFAHDPTKKFKYNGGLPRRCLEEGFYQL